MNDKCLSYVGNWIKLDCKTFSCSGKIESIKPDKIILSNSVLSDDRVSTRFVGIDINLIESMDFISAPINKIAEQVKRSSLQQTVNVYTSENRPPSIRRGGPSSAVSRNLNRQKSLEKFSKVRKSSVSSDFNCESLKSNIKNMVNEPAWFNFSPEDMDTDFDFDKNLALFDKDSLVGNSKKCSNESSDSSDSTNLHLHLNTKQKNQILSWKNSKSQSINFDPEDFSSYDNNINLKFNGNPDDNVSDSAEIKRDILSAFKNIGIIPSSLDNTSNKVKDLNNDPQFSFYNKLFHQPDLVREITQKQQIKKDVCRRSCRSLISINETSNDFPGFAEFWNLDNGSIFPVFTVKQRDILFESASQLGIEIKSIYESVGSTIGEFIFTQVELYSRINGHTIMDRSPKIAVLLGKCTASLHAIYVADYLLKRGCHIVVFIDENKTSDTNYRIEYELRSFSNLLYHSGNLITEKVEDLNNETFDYVISGVESNSSKNNPNYLLKKWCLEQPSHILCINPPKTSYLVWTSAVFIGVPTLSQMDIKKIFHNQDKVDVISIDKSSEKTDKKFDEVILLCNSYLVQRVFSFLKLNYQSPFITRNLVRLYRDNNDLCFVE